MQLSLCMLINPARNAVMNRVSALAVHEICSNTCKRVPLLERIIKVDDKGSHYFSLLKANMHAIARC